MENSKLNEGTFAEAIENETSKMTPDLIFWAALGGVVLSIGLRYAGKKKASKLVSQWATPILLMGLYNKVFKAENHGKDDSDYRY
jgi:hypothetical protein